AARPGPRHRSVEAPRCVMSRGAGPVAERRPADRVVRLRADAAVDEGTDLTVRALVVLRAVGHCIGDAVLVDRGAAVPLAAEEAEPGPVHVCVCPAVDLGAAP